MPQPFSTSTTTAAGAAAEPVAAIVYVVEPSRPAQRSLAWILRSAGFHVVDYACGEELLADLSEDVPGCVLIHQRLATMSGVAVLEELGRRGIGMPVILFSRQSEVTAAVEAFRSGAYDVVGERFDLSVVERVRRALGVERRLRQRRMAQAELRARLSRLTPREREIAEMVARGAASKVIAFDLDISERTVECHRSRLMRKIGARSLADLVRIVVLAGDLDSDDLL